jgi:hypothetical protein
VANTSSSYYLFFQQQHEKKTYDILAKELGKEDSRTKDSENWIKTFKMREQQVPFAYCKVK